jgi:hypothetical protein
MNKTPNNNEHAAYCPICSTRHADDVVRVVEESQRQTVVHVVCAKCRASAFLFISNAQYGSLSVAVLTDLTKDEVESRFRAAAVKAHHAIDVYKHLKEYTGSVKDFLG